MVAENNDMTLPIYLGSLEDVCGYINKYRKEAYVNQNQVLSQLERNKEYIHSFNQQVKKAKEENDLIGQMFFQMLLDYINEFEVIVNDRYIIVQTELEEE